MCKGLLVIALPIYLKWLEFLYKNLLTKNQVIREFVI